MRTIRASILLLILGALALTGLLLGSCAKKLEGNVYENEKPKVWFVNVPPENARSSVNPIVNWYGQDRDGQISFYRYIVLREDIMDDSLGLNSGVELTGSQVQQFVDEFLLKMPDSLWTKLLVRADSSNPHTSNIIPMSAEINNPVLVYVPQFVFVQAFDEEGLGSDIVFRRFLRNDNPPQTRIVGFIDNVPFINSVLPTGSATGIRIRWQGSDVIDYPTDPPPFDFEWKLFGPYSDADYAALLDSFLVKVFITNDARVFRFGLPPQTIYDTFWNPDHTVIDSIKTRLLPTALIICDTTYENGVEIESCDTILIDTLTGNNIYGSMDTLLRVYEDDFINSNKFYIVADSSHDEFGNNWLTDTRDSIYNVYWNHPADTTQAGKFLFVVRCRDDAQVPDLTPAWRGFIVINPQHERDVLIVDFAVPAAENNAKFRSMQTYWDSTVTHWISETQHSQVLFSKALDIHNEQDYGSTVPRNFLADVLRYKVLIAVQDAEISGAWSSQGEKVQNVITALQTGVNVWVVTRVPYGNHGTGSSFAVHEISPQYQYFFGVQQYTFPGWSSYFYVYQTGCPRTEDFIGTLSLDEEQWPPLEIDTFLLRNRYKWEGTNCITNPDSITFPFYPYMPTLGALPQVGWFVRTYETECMYLYKSLYGSEHAIFRSLSFQGRPVGIRLNRGLFRTVHFLFTPLAMKVATGQPMANGVLNWLYDGRLSQSSAGKLSGQEASLSEDLDNRYWECYWKADGDIERFYELLRNAY